MTRITEIVKKIRKQVFKITDMMHIGGNWLGTARNWILWNARNGDSVDWGSHDRIDFSRSLTVKDIEEFAASIAVATLEQYKEHLVTDGEKLALTQYMNKENWSSYISDKQNGNLVAFRPNRDKMHFAASYKHKNGWDLAECVDGVEDEAT